MEKKKRLDILSLKIMLNLASSTIRFFSDFEKSINGLNILKICEELRIDLKQMRSRSGGRVSTFSYYSYDVLD